MRDLCAICGHSDPGEGRYACTACAYRMRCWLSELPRQLPVLQASLIRDGAPPQHGSGGRAHAPIPVRLDVLSLLGPGQPLPVDDPHGDHTGGIPITVMLRGWARYLASEHPAVRTDSHGTQYVGPCEDAATHHGAGTAAWCHWLRAYLPYAVTRPWISDLHEQLDDLLRQVRGITRTVPQRRLKTAPCPRCDAFALVAVDGEWHIRCEACPAELTPDEYAAHAAAVLPALTRIAIRMVTAAAVERTVA